VTHVRLRTTDTSNNGIPSLSAPAGSLSTDLSHVVYTRDASGQARIYVGGAEVVSGTFGGDLSNWDDSYPMLLANEATGTGPWLGELHLVAVYERALTPAEVGRNFDAGPDGAGGLPALVTRTITYTYDGLYRLTEADYSSGERFEYAYDAVGNMTAVTTTITSTVVSTREYDIANRLITVTTGSTPDLAAGGAEAGFAGEGDEKLVLTARANIASVATVRVATEHQALDDLIDVGPLIWGHFVFQPQIVPAVPVVEEDLAEAVVTGGMVGATPRG
jgi:YD repeat-containing protein